jgi:signal transduction histidine kinase
MSEEFKKKYFKTNVLIKNIIGKELINDDNVAVMELVKNSYDAGASKVTIEFKNIFSKNKDSELIIQDDGIGMSEDDILNKWLNIAYSAKKLEHTQNERYQAGNKGVGRFSCDRLGKKLNIYTRQKDKTILHLRINWKDFELLNEIDTQIQDIAVYIREIEDTKFKIETGFDIFSNGTILQIQQLNNIWVEIDSKNSLFTDLEINSTRLLKLKSSLERLINPNQSYSKNSFKIYIKANELHEDNNIPYHEKVTGEIKNQIFDKLDFKTTFIVSFISKDGSKIVTELKDKNKTIFKLIENNKEFPLLKDIKISIYYLNPYAKGFFKKQTGIRSVEFGSIFLFINGFRIPPYGDRDNDALGLEVRKNQGRARFFGNRDIIGQIEIKDFDNKFRVISSREGIVRNDYYKQLIRDDERKSGKYNGYFYTTLKRIEKYVVEGLKWDSLPEELNESTVQKEIVDGVWDSSTEIYKIDDRKKLINSSEIIKQMLSIKNQDVLDLYINDELIENLIEEDKEKTQKKLQDFLKNFGSLGSNAFNEETKKSLEKLTSKIEDKELVSLYQDVLAKKDKIEEDLEEEKKSKDELYKLYRQKIREQRRKAREEKKIVEDELKKVKKENEQQEKQVLFLQSLQTLDADQLINLQHHIGLYAHDIEGMLISFKKQYNRTNIIDEKSFFELLERLTLSNKKILTINKLATKSNFLSDSEEIDADLVSFIYEYINNIYLIEDRSKVNIEVTHNNLYYKTLFSPFEFTIILDNLIQNAKKVNKPKKISINIDISLDDDNFKIEFYDNGKGLDKNIDNPSKIFSQGFTTTNGSGLGLYHVKQMLNKYNFQIDIDEEYKNGFKLIIKQDRGNNEISI